MRALSIRQPWAWLIVNGHKDIENRSWPTKFRGEVLIHASKGMTNAEYEDVATMLLVKDDLRHLFQQLPDRDTLERGGIVGIANITDCVAQSDSPWFFGEHGFVLRDAKPLPFAPFKGSLGFFDVPSDVIAAAMAATQPSKKEE